MTIRVKYETDKAQKVQKKTSSVIFVLLPLLVQ